MHIELMDDTGQTVHIRAKCMTPDCGIADRTSILKCVLLVRCVQECHVRAKNMEINIWTWKAAAPRAPVVSYLPRV